MQKGRVSRFGVQAGYGIAGCMHEGYCWTTLGMRAHAKITKHTLWSAGASGGRGRGRGRGRRGGGRGRWGGAAAMDRDLENAYAEAAEVDADGDDPIDAIQVAQGLEAMKRAIGEAAAPLVKGSRLKQIIEWLEAGDGDPLIVFDVRACSPYPACLSLKWGWCQGVLRICDLRCHPG